MYADVLSYNSATAAGIIKVWYLHIFGVKHDILWDSANVTIWAACELNVAIFAASIACLRPLIRLVFRCASNDEADGNNRGDPNSFVKHISNSQGTNAIGDSNQGRETGFEMYGTVVTANGNRGRAYLGSESQESILGLHDLGILKTTQVSVTTNDNGPKHDVDGPQ